MSRGSVRVELLTSPACPNAGGARALVDACLARLGLDVAVVERVGDYPSPTVLVNGVDVMTPGREVPPVRACRLDLPTAPRILRALQLPRPDRTEADGDRARR
jgi:hypothetical protein